MTAHSNKQKVFKEALLEVSKGKGLQHSCLDSDLQESCCTAERWAAELGFHHVLLPECSRSSRALLAPWAPLPTLHPSCPAHLSKPCCAWLWARGSDTAELTWPWRMWPCAHRQSNTSLLYQLQGTGSLLCHQCPPGSRRWPEEPWAHCTALVQFTLIFYCPFQEEPLPNTLAPAFPTCQESFPMPEFVLSFTKQNHIHMENQHPPSLDNS